VTRHHGEESEEAMSTSPGPAGGSGGDRAAPTDSITPDQIVGKFRELQSGVGEAAAARKTSLLQIAAAGGVVLLLIVFLLGRRTGTRRSTFVEIRRI
jgi:hypothetical protein